MMHNPWWSLVAVLLIVTIGATPAPSWAQKKSPSEKPKATKHQGIKPESVQLKLEKPAAATTDQLSTLTGKGSLDGIPKTFNLAASETHLSAADQKTIVNLKKEPNQAIEKAASDAFKTRNFAIAHELNQFLSQRNPANASYFFSSEICPLCGISRTQAQYQFMQSTLMPE